MKKLGRGGKRNVPPPPLKQNKSPNKFPITVQMEKRRDPGYLISPDSKSSTTFGIQRVIKILKEQEDKEYNLHGANIRKSQLATSLK